jgi:hypothetical protein
MQLVLANLLIAHAPLKALVDNRIHWDTMPQGLVMPNIVMFVISGVTSYTMRGASDLAMTRVQFDSRGATAASARAVANALNDRLSGFSGVYAGFKFQGCFAQGQRTRFDKDGNATWFTDSRDFVFHWSPA